jgi:phthalate 4,5-dioxygenase oxygenase subunit
MLSRENNERITRVGAGTPMGETMRRYWMPVLLAWELPEPDCAPVRVRLLGEDLVAFRTTDGRIGMVEEFCPHRRASLWFGRNEENGLRCAYHGWKFDIEGNCTEQMNEPREFCSKVGVTAYPALEIGGVSGPIWGPPRKNRRRLTMPGPKCPKISASPRKWLRNAIGCRPSKAVSIRPTSPFCTGP